jgi:hypothetical protein
MNVVREGSIPSETKNNMVSYTLEINTTIIPLYETQTEGKSKHYSPQSPSACKLVPVALTVERRFCKAEALGSIPSGYIPTGFRPLLISSRIRAQVKSFTTTIPVPCAHDNN